MRNTRKSDQTFRSKKRPLPILRSGRESRINSNTSYPTQVRVIEVDSPRPLNEISSSKRVRLHAGAHFDHAACPYSVTQAGHAFGLGAMVAAEELAFLFEAVTEDMNAAIVAGWSQRMDRTLEAVEGVGGAVHAHLKRLVVVVSAGFAFGHDLLPFG